MNSQLDRAIKIAANTGDKIIVIDEENNRSLAVMNLDEYEKLLNGENKGNTDIKNLTEEELLDKINRDIVIWKDANEDKKFLAEMPDLNDDFEDEETEEASGFSDSASGEDSVIKEDSAPEVEMKEEVEENPSVNSGQAKETEENLYYYNEPEKPEVPAEPVHEETGFTSIKDEIKKNRRAWEIPAVVKQAAEDVKI